MADHTASQTKAAARRATILQAAADVFFEHGFSAVSVDMIIERVGGSKRTIYNAFGNKEALFTALVTEISDNALLAFSSNDVVEQDLRHTLELLARNLIAVYTSKSLIGLYRVTIAESYRFPHLARAIYENGPGRAAAAVKDILDAAAAKGELRPIDTAAAADQFIGMIRDNLHLQVVMGLRAMPAADELEARAVSAADIFLNGVCAPDHDTRTRALPVADKPPTRKRRVRTRSGVPERVSR